jgi:hypothetical protein
MKGNRPTALLAARNSGGRNLNLDDEIKGAEAHPYQYGVVGGSPSPNGAPSLGSGTAATAGGGYHSQPSTMGYGHHKNSSRDALMTAHSPPVSPRHLDVPLPGGGVGQQRRASQYTGSSGGTDTIVMANQPPVGMANPMTGNDMGGVGGVGGGGISDERDTSWMVGHQPRPSSSLLEAPVLYPPGHGGFYQQYGPIDHVQSQQQQQQPQPQPQQQQQQPAVPAHQALYAAAGLGPPDFYARGGQGQGQQGPSRVLASPPPGAAGARQYITSTGVAGTSGAGDVIPVPASATSTSTSTSPDIGFGRQRRSGEKERRPEGAVRSPVIQHQDGGRVSDGDRRADASASADGHSGDAPPPAYSDP